MRETKRCQKSPVGGDMSTLAPSTPGSASASVPCPSPSSNRQPRTPKQEMDVPVPSNVSRSSSESWSQPRTPGGSQIKTIKTESVDMPPPTPEAIPVSLQSPGAASGPGGYPAGRSLLTSIPSSPLDQFKKEDPMEKMAQMADSIGSSHVLLSLRSPSASSASPSSPTLHSRPSVITQQPHLSSRNIQSAQVSCSPGPQLQMQMGGFVGAGPNDNPMSNQGPQVPEQPYMQQQSIIYVFSTELANRAATLVQEQRFPSIIEVHMQEKETQRILDHNFFNRPPGPFSQRSGIWPAVQRAGHGHPGDRMATGRPFPVRKTTLNTNASANATALGATLADNMLTPEQARLRADKLERLRQMQEKLLPGEDISGSFAGMMSGGGAGGPASPAPPPPPPYSLCSHSAPESGSMTARAGRSTIMHRRQNMQFARHPNSGVMNQMQSPIMMSAHGQEMHGHGQHDMMMMKSGQMLDQVVCLSPTELPSYADYVGQNGQKGMMATNVMPVPSPQPIQYVSSQLDVQEVVIQKQPNRSFLRSQPDCIGSSGNAFGQNVQNVNPNSNQYSSCAVSAVGSSQSPSPVFSHPHMESCRIRHGHPPPHPHAHVHAHPHGHSYALHQQQQQQLHQSMMDRPQFAPAAATAGQAGQQPMALPSQLPSQPQTVNNTYVNAHMTIERVNIQNLPFDNPNQYSHSHSQDMLHMQQQRQQQQQSISMPIQEAPFPGSMSHPYEGAPQIHIKPGTTSTIQYLPNPNRPLPPAQPRPPPNLDFLHHWTGSNSGPAPASNNGANNGPSECSVGRTNAAAAARGSFGYGGGTPSNMSMPGVNMYNGPSTAGGQGEMGISLNMHIMPGPGGMMDGGQSQSLSQRYSSHHMHPQTQMQQQQQQPSSNEAAQYAEQYHHFQEQIYARNVQTDHNNQRNLHSAAASLPRLQ